MREDTISIEQAGLEPREDADRVQRTALTVGLIGGAATAIGYLTSSEHFFRTYLVAWLLWLGVAMGLFGLSMLNHLAGGRWGVLMRRVMEASGRTLPFFLVLFLPLALNLDKVYPWAREGVLESDPLLRHKAVFFDQGFFLGRTVFYLVAWWLLAHFMSVWSHRHDETGERSYLERMQRLSAAGAVLYVLTATIASVDWIMSLDPHWFSSLHGIAFVAGQGLSGFAFAVPMLVFLSRRKPLNGLVHRERVHDYGKLMLAFTMLWTYFMISQYLIIWSGNLPEEITWYLHRSGHGWQTITLVLVLGHFALPFFLLLMTDITRYARRLMVVACWVLAMRWLDLYWQVAPSFGHDGIVFHWLDVAALAAIGGLWIWLLVAQFKNRALLPVREPTLKEILAHG